MHDVSVPVSHNLAWDIFIDRSEPVHFPVANSKHKDSCKKELQVGKEFLLNLHTERSLTENTIPDAVLIQFDLLMIAQSCSKHVEDTNNNKKHII